jgi:hypothetical protein
MGRSLVSRSVPCQFVVSVPRIGVTGRVESLLIRRLILVLTKRGVRSKPFGTMVLEHIRAWLFWSPNRGLGLADLSNRPFPYADGEIRTQLLAKVATGTTFRVCKMRVTPLIAFQRMSRTKSHAVTAAFAPRRVNADP